MQVLSVPTAVFTRSGAGRRVGGWGGAWLHEQGGVADAPRRLERLGHRLLLGTAPVLLGGILCVLQNV